MAEQLSTEPPSPPRDTPAEKLPLASVLTYAPPIVGASALLFFVTFFVMNFARGGPERGPSLKIGTRLDRGPL